MKIAIMGAGGVGGYFGGRLARADQQVVFIARGAHLEAMKTKGLKVGSIKGDFYLPSVTVTDDPCQAGLVDLVMVCVKTWQLNEAMQAMKPLIGRNTLVLPLLNGVEAYDQLKAGLDEGIILCGLTRILSYIAEPGHIQHTSIEPYIGLGIPGGGHIQRVRTVCEVFKRAGIKSEIPSGLPEALWAKFLFVAGWGGVGAVTGCAAGVIRAIPETRSMLRQSMQEIFDLAAARHVQLSENMVDQCMGYIDKMDPASTTSLQRDIAAGRPSELESWNGAVVRLGKESDVPAPVNNFIYAALLAREKSSLKNKI
ncbi:MAG: 2-dehydropantoate 2-reductase [Desulfobacteraceae bacterium]|nr:2-dehydropantoate 2-reductase [Desulfobacteraceae bacterium]